MRRRRENLAFMSLILLILFSIPTVHIAPVSADETTKLYVDPPNTVDPTFFFTIDVTLANITNLFCWEYKLKWNSTIIELVSHAIHAPAGWKGWVYDVVGADYHWYARSARGGDPPDPLFNGSMSLCTYTFQLLDVGNCTLDLYDTILADYNITDIPHSVEDGYFENTQIPIPPWDVNGDGKVNIKDIGIVAVAFGSAAVDNPETPQDETENWNPIADVNFDGKINIKDIGIVAIHFGERV